MSASKPPQPFGNGSVIAGKYRIDKMLGEGGMGTVWAAKHIELGQSVALKLIAPELARSADLLARFKAEAKAAATLESRYVVRMYDSGVTEDGRPYIAMEYLKGESLEDRLNRLGTLPLAVTVRIIGQVCKALQRAHSNGIIHRDLKPANIFLATTGDEEEIAKVLDFGIAKVLSHEGDHGTTATGIILGTPLYMSPEQARALKSLDHRTDLYSIGMVTYRMLVGDTPFAGESFGDLVYEICTQPLPSLHEKVPALPPTLDAWFQIACAKDAQARFPTAMEMFNGLVAASGLSTSQLAGAGDAEGYSMPGSALGVHAGSMSEFQLSTRTGVGPITTGTGVTMGNELNRRKTPLWAIATGAVAVLALGGGAAYVMLGGDQKATAGDEATAQVAAALMDPGPTAAPPPAENAPETHQPQADKSTTQPTVAIAGDGDPTTAEPATEKNAPDVEAVTPAAEESLKVPKQPAARRKPPPSQASTPPKPPAAAPPKKPDMGF